MNLIAALVTMTVVQALVAMVIALIWALMNLIAALAIVTVLEKSVVMVIALI